MGAQWSGMWDGVNRDIQAIVSSAAGGAGGASCTPHAAVAAFGSPLQAVTRSASKSPLLLASPVAKQLRAAREEATDAVAAAKAVGKVRTRAPNCEGEACVPSGAPHATTTS